MKTLSVIVPFFNEERTLPELVRQLSELPKEIVNSVIFVNDGSNDKSLLLLEATLQTSTLNYKVVNKINGGKASAIKEGVNHVETTHVVILDSDLELATSDLTKLWHIVQSDLSDVVFGYRRFLAQSSFTWRYSKGNLLISNLYGILFNEVITDIMCGYKLVPTNILKSLNYRYRRFGLEIEIPMKLWQEKIRPYEIEVSYKARTRAEGKSISIQDAIIIIFSLVHFRTMNRRNRE